MVPQFRMPGGRTLLLVLAAVGLTLGAALLVERLSVGVLKAGIGGLALIIALGAVASHWLIRPLDGLTESLLETARTGSFAPDFPEHSGIREVSRLAQALNRAAQAVRHSQVDLDRAYLEFVETMAQALDARDPYTAGHSIRVGAYSYAIARALGVQASQAETIRIAARLHDIGKIGIPDVILQKPDALTPEEYGLIKLHPQIGRKILSKVTRFEKLLPVVELHHENHDGTGYPYKLSGDRIPLDVRIVHVADAFDAMTTNRSYRTALPLSLAIEDIRASAGTQFDPEVVEVFLKLIAEGKPASLLVGADQGLLAGYQGAYSVDREKLPVPSGR